MKNLTSTMSRLVVVLSGALALGACSRANYAVLPRSASYLGSTTVAPKTRSVAPVTPPAPAAAAESAPAKKVAAQPTQVANPVAPTPKAVAPAAQRAEPAAVAAAPEASQPEAKVADKVAPRKLNLVQRIALNKVLRKLDKQQKAMARQGDNIASTAKGTISGNLRIGIILLLVGLLVGLLNGLIGTIIAIIGLVFIILWLLDEL